MVAQVEAKPAANGVLAASNINGKPIKSKNQLRRLKHKLKKTAPLSQVGPSYCTCALAVC
jgi:splicing factor 3B subunit 2